MKQLFWGVILTLISGYIARTLYTDKVELVYALSQNIPMTFYGDSDKTEQIQQLEIKNNGDIPAQKIVIHVNKKVTDYSIQKYSRTDSVKVHSANNFEINYMALPPEGVIKFILKTQGEEITSSDLSISHDRGVATNILNVNSSFDYFSLIILLLYGAVFLFFLFVNIKTAVYSSFDTDLQYKPYDKILLRSKPFYLSKEKWDELRKKAINKIFDSDYSTNVATHQATKILQANKPSQLEDGEWNEILNLSENKYTKLIIDKAERSYYNRESEVFNLKKPKNFSEESWDKVVKAISEIYTINILSNALKLSYVTSYQDLIKSEKPEIIGQSYWDALISKIQKMLFCELHLEVIDFSNPRGVLERREITLLSLEQQEKLRAIAERLVEATKTENSLRVKVRLLNKLTSEQQIGETKPDEVSEEIWKQLKDLEDEFVLQRKDTEEKLYEINKLSSTLHPLKSKLEKQMEIINEVLSDPSAITRIEDYSNPFSEGNFKNLVKISTLMANAS